MEKTPEQLALEAKQKAETFRAGLVEKIRTTQLDAEPTAGTVMARLLLLERELASQKFPFTQPEAATQTK